MTHYTFIQSNLFCFCASCSISVSGTAADREGLFSREGFLTFSTVEASRKKRKREGKSFLKVQDILVIGKLYALGDCNSREFIVFRAGCMSSITNKEYYILYSKTQNGCPLFDTLYELHGTRYHTCRI